MRFREARQVLEYWNENPPEHEMLCTLARMQGWEPRGKPPTEAEVIAAHRKSLEQRWAAGAMNPKQLYEASGGFISADGTAGVKPIGGNLPGIGPFPGAQ